MKSLFPDTPTLRYERMLLAAIASAIFLFLGLQFGEMAVRFAAETSASAQLALLRPALNLILFVAPCIGFILLSIAYLIAALIKIDIQNKASHFHWFILARTIAIRLIWIAFGFAALWVAAHVALQIAH